MQRLIGRQVVLHRPHNGRIIGKIAEHICGMRFGLHLDGYEACGRPITVDCHRAEFKLPRLPYRLFPARIEDE